MVDLILRLPLLLAIVYLLNATGWYESWQKALGATLFVAILLQLYVAGSL